MTAAVVKKSRLIAKSIATAAVLLIAATALPKPSLSSPNEVTGAPVSLGSLGSFAKAGVQADGSSRNLPYRFAVLPRPDIIKNGKYIATLSSGQVANLSLNLGLQRYVEDLVRRAQAPHIAIVVMNPSNGRLIAYASKSKTIPNLLTHAGFPAASLFKVVTSAAALERSSLEPDSLIPYRGGTYELARWNYSPDPRRDRKLMTFTNALAKSSNAVFGRVALNYISSSMLQFYANAFGFNQSLGFEAPLQQSSASIPADNFERSRTGAGFGEVFISPIHAAAIMSGVANRGVMPQPSLIESIELANNRTMAITASMHKRMISPATAAELLSMMVATTRVGTSKRDFMLKKKPALGITVAAKTGTLRGSNPVGLNHWFIAAAPISSPKIAIAIISIDPRNSSGRPAHLGRQIIDQFL